MRWPWRRRRPANLETAAIAACALIGLLQERGWLEGGGIDVNLDGCIALLAERDDLLDGPEVLSARALRLMNSASPVPADAELAVAVLLREVHPEMCRRVAAAVSP